MTYPILVERYTGNQALTIICQYCERTEVIDPDDLLNEGLYDCPRHCGGSAVHKYEEADKCPGCGTLGFYDKALEHCCSRRCVLVAEYAKTLKAPAYGEAA